MARYQVDLLSSPTAHSFSPHNSSVSIAAVSTVPQMVFQLHHVSTTPRISIITGYARRCGERSLQCGSQTQTRTSNRTWPGIPPSHLDGVQVYNRKDGTYALCRAHSTMVTTALQVSSATSRAIGGTSCNTKFGPVCHGISRNLQKRI